MLTILPRHFAIITTDQQQEGFKLEVYLDNNATTRVDDEVLDTMRLIYIYDYGNPNSLHRKGSDAAQHMEDSRRILAKLLGVKSKEIFFTSGATESINWVMRSVARLASEKRNKLIIGAVEHKAVLKTAHDIAKIHNLDIAILPVDEKGVYLLDELEKKLDETVLLVALMSANNEVGTLQPVEEISKLVRSKAPRAFLLVDAVQSFGKSKMDLKAWNPDFLVLSAHKFHGPKGIGLLYAREGRIPFPLITGGEQERGFRAGTQNVPGIVGMARAAELAVKDLEKNIEKMRKFQKLIAEKVETLGGVIITPLNNSLPNTITASFPGILGHHLLNALSLEKIYVSTHSACSSSESTSHVLEAMGIKGKIALGAIRISTSRMTTEEEISFFLETLEKVLKFLGFDR